MLEEKEEPGFLTGLKIPAPWAAGKTVETVHPVRDNYKFKETVHIPGARCLYLRFDSRCSSQYDYDKVSWGRAINSTLGEACKETGAALMPLLKGCRSEDPRGQPRWCHGLAPLSGALKKCFNGLDLPSCHSAVSLVSLQLVIYAGPNTNSRKVAEYGGNTLGYGSRSVLGTGWPKDLVKVPNGPFLSVLMKFQLKGKKKPLALQVQKNRFPGSWAEGNALSRFPSVFCNNKTRRVSFPWLV